MGQFAIAALGGAGQGFAQGQQIAQEQAFKKQTLDLAQKKFKLEEQEGQLKMQVLQHQIKQQGGLQALLEKLLSGGQAGGAAPGIETPAVGQPVPPMMPSPEGGMVPAPQMGGLGGLELGGINIGKEGPSFQLRRPERPVTVGPGGTLVSPQGKPLFQSPTGEAKPSFDDAQIGQALAQKLGRPATPAEFLAEKQRMKLETATAMPTEFTQGGIDLSAWQYLQTGVTPSMGFGARGTVAQVQVRNRAAEIASSYGLTPQDILQGRTSVKAAQSALSGLEKQAASVLSFAKTADLNLGMAERLSGQVGRTGVPVFNRAAISGQRQVFGDPDVAAFHAATRVAINEFARVTTSVTGGGVTSDQARKEIEDILLTAYTPEQFSRVVATLRAEMQNRIAGYQEGGHRIRESLTGAFAPQGSPGTPGLVGPAPQQAPISAPVPSGPAPTGGKRLRFNPQTGRIE